MLMDMTVRDFLKLASNSPAPGGGVCHPCQEPRCGLVCMVARLSEKQPIPDGVEETGCFSKGRN